MKKFIAVAAALVSFSAFAHNHMENRHMVRLEGYEGNRTDRSVDLYWSSDDQKTENKEQNIALNYAYAVTDAWQIGAMFKKNDNDSVSGTTLTEKESMEYGLRVIYNFAGKLVDTNWLSLGYSMGETESKSGGTKTETDTNTWSLEFGHRFHLGNLWGMSFNWSPSVELSQLTTDTKGSKEYDTQAIGINVLAVDVLF